MQIASRDVPLPTGMWQSWSAFGSFMLSAMKLIRESFVPITYLEPEK